MSSFYSPLETARAMIIFKLFYFLKNLVNQLTLLDKDLMTISRETYLNSKSSFWYTRISLQLVKKFYLFNLKLISTINESSLINLQIRKIKFCFKRSIQ